MTAVSGTRGERNQNPGNLIFMKAGMWRGQVGIEEVPKGMAYTPRFGRYDTEHNGIRALAKQLLTYQSRDGLRTPRQIINRYAPASENATNAYLDFFCGKCGVGPDEPFALAALSKLILAVTAIIAQENGRVLYDADLIRDACRDALGLPCPALTQP